MNLYKKFLEVQEDRPDDIVFVRCGDFYETFDIDAQIVSRALDLTLTSRLVDGTNRKPMAGVPYHKIDDYVAKLIDKGYTVSVVENL